MGVPRLACTYGRNKVTNCPPAVIYKQVYFITRFPDETTKIWNLTKLLTPTAWIWTFSAIVLTVVALKCFTLGKGSKNFKISIFESDHPSKN